MSSSTLAQSRISISSQTLTEVQSLSAPQGAALVLRMPDGTLVDLPRNVHRLVMQALTAVAHNGSATIVQLPEELTSTVAADLLGVSRPTLMKWARGGIIDSFKVGSHTRFRRADVSKLREEREMERRAAFEELRSLDAENDFEFFAD